MLSFGRFLRPISSFRPKTPAAARRAVRAGVGSLEEFVHQGTSVKPLIEEPYMITELQRILSRQDLDLETSLLLIWIFRRMLRDPDPERALFGAEAITTIETRYEKRIEALRARLTAGEEVRLDLAQSCYEVGLLNYGTPAIRAFYLLEAFEYLRPLIEAEALEAGFLSVCVGVLEALGLYDQAESLLARARMPQDTDVLYLRARIAFRRGRYGTVSQIMRRLRLSYNRLPERARLTVDQWAPARVSRMS